MGQSAVIIKSNPNGLVLMLNPDLPFEDLRSEVAEKFRASANFFKKASLALTFRGRALTNEQESLLVEEIVQNSGICVICVVDESKETEDYYKKAVTDALDKREEQKQEAHKQEDGQFYRGTLRSGQVLETETSIVVIGDVNPGAQVISKGNIVVLGCCMGSLYAGAAGDTSCFAAALTMKPMQVRIGDKMARSAIVKKADTGEYPMDPKIIYIKEEHLQIKPITSETLNDYFS